MSFDNSLGVMNDGFWNETGDNYMRFESMGLLGELTPPPPPPGSGSGGSGTDGGFSSPLVGAMSPLHYWHRTRLHKEEIDPWRDSTMLEDELDGQRGSGEVKKAIKHSKE